MASESIGELTWSCHICGEERPDARISVVKTDTSDQYGLPLGTVEQNVRYCNDNPDCRQKAQHKQLIGGKAGEREEADDGAG